MTPKLSGIVGWNVLPMKDRSPRNPLVDKVLWAIIFRWFGPPGLIVMSAVVTLNLLTLWSTDEARDSWAYSTLAIIWAGLMIALPLVVLTVA